MTGMSDLSEAQNAVINMSPLATNETTLNKKARKPKKKIDGILQPRDEELRRESHKVKSLISPTNSTLGSSGGY